MAEAPGSGGFIGNSYPSGAYGYDISNFQCGNFPTGAHTIGIVQVDGASGGPANSCLAKEVAWAGAGLNLYTFLTYGASATNEPGCNNDQACNAGYQAGIQAFNDAASPASTPMYPGGSTSRTIRSPRGRRAPGRTRPSSKERSTRCMKARASPPSGSMRAPTCGTPSSATRQPSVPYWMADYLASPSGPGSCADYAELGDEPWRQLPGPPEIVQYFSGPVPGSPGNYDDDYAC